MENTNESKRIKIFTVLCRGYLQILSKTCKIRIINEENVDINNSVIGCWHGETFPAYLLLERLTDLKLTAITTSDSRGDYISALMSQFGVTPLRLPNGVAARHGIAEAIELGKNDEKLSLFFSIDGPLGPYHEPKKMVFHIAQKCNKKYIGVNIKVKGKVTFFARWDKYIVPLPFSSITFKIRTAGDITTEKMKNYANLRQDVVNLMEGE